MRKKYWPHIGHSMDAREKSMTAAETVDRIEPALLSEAPSEITDVVAELSAKAATLGSALHPRAASNLADLVRIMNTYYSNLIEGHHTRPRDIERALSGELDQDDERRNLQLEAKAHIRVQAEIDRLFADGRLPDPTSSDFILNLHLNFYRDAPESMLLIKGAGRVFRMEPGKWRSLPEHDVAVGRHLPPSSERVPDFMRHFERRYEQKGIGKGSRILALPAAHHRLNYIHPFPDGNGRVSRLMSHAMAHTAGIGAHGLWSVSRGLARGIESQGEYKSMMDSADMPRQNDLDGRGNLSLQALKDFTLWFLMVCLDQVNFMSGLFEIDALAQRYRKHVAQSRNLKPESSRLLEEALVRGEIDRGEISRITGLPERTARRVLSDVLAEGLLGSSTPKGPVSLRFPSEALEALLPRLYVQS
jgi:Fic family protein